MVVCKLSHLLVAARKKVFLKRQTAAAERDEVQLDRIVQTDVVRVFGLPRLQLVSYPNVHVVHTA